MNDRHGHRAGETCLVRFAKVLERNLHAGDWISRWGGDEFVVGMWNAHEEQTSELALGRIAEELHRSPVARPDGEQTRLIFSGGTCRSKAGDDVRALILRADMALYQAKAEGGNTVVGLA